jgi:transposase
MDQRQRFILEWRSNKVSKTVLCELFGVSRQTGYKWSKRFKPRSWRSLEEQSRRPKRSPRETPNRLVKRIMEMRRRHPTWGPKKLRVLLQRHWPEVRWPAASTIGEVLKRNGVVKTRRRRYRAAPRTRPVLEVSRARTTCGAWDFKGQFATRDGASSATR